MAQRQKDEKAHAAAAKRQATKAQLEEELELAEEAGDKKSMAKLKVSIAKTVNAEVDAGVLPEVLDLTVAEEVVLRVPTVKMKRKRGKVPLFNPTPIHLLMRVSFVFACRLDDWYFATLNWTRRNKKISTHALHLCLRVPWS